VVIQGLGFAPGCMWNRPARYRGGGWQALRRGKDSGRPGRLSAGISLGFPRRWAAAKRGSRSVSPWAAWRARQNGRWFRSGMGTRCIGRKRWKPYRVVRRTTASFFDAFVLTRAQSCRAGAGQRENRTVWAVGPCRDHPNPGRPVDNGGGYAI